MLPIEKLESLAQSLVPDAPEKDRVELDYTHKNPNYMGPENCVENIYRTVEYPDGHEYTQSRALFPMENGGVFKFSFNTISKSTYEDFIKEKALPLRLLNPVLEYIGFGRKYLKIDTEKIRGREYIDQYISTLIDHKQHGWIFMGGVGTGKTTNMAYVAREYLTKGKDHLAYLYMRFININALYQCIFDKEKREELQEIRSAKILFIDDLGHAYESKYSSNCLEAIICHRYDNLLPTIFTTNLDMDQIREMDLWFRMADRFEDRDWMLPPLEIVGESMRKAK
jgi:hypothetical protein